jgi:hypothetical protein
VLIATASLSVNALLAFALSFVAFLVQTSKHRPSRGWVVAAGILREAIREVQRLGEATGVKVIEDHLLGSGHEPRSCPPSSIAFAPACILPPFK